MKKLIVRLSIKCDYSFAQSILDEVSTQTTTNSSFLTKGKTGDEIVIEFSSINDLLNLNRKKYSEVWENAISSIADEITRERYVRNNVEALNTMLYEFIDSINQANNAFNHCINTNDTLNEFTVAPYCSYIFNAKRILMLGNLVAIIKRGESISDHLTETDLLSYNYKENLRNVKRTQDHECLLFATDPKRKRTAKPTLYLKQMTDVVLIVPVRSNIRFSIDYE
ncbi:hypothetical protein [Photobacterium leiognathi]|uniref:hypothetical protein n=1 Tax=Photobacterium leiognathi TaxID=553611 RepID=UPI002981BD3F|nr:hypothetical protein [Photobacterium leiognathi]